MKPWIIAAVVFVSACSGSPTAPTPPPLVNVPPPVVAPPPAPMPTFPPVDPWFDIAFYRQFVHATLTNAPVPLSRWTRAPWIYVQTRDNLGMPVSPALIEQTAAAIINTTAHWTGGTFGVAGLETGTDTREGVPGWLTVKWTTVGVCGTTNGVGVEGGSIVMNHRRPECTCGPLVAKHELGHALGYYHTDSNNDLMAATFQGVCDKNLSRREIEHAPLAYSRPVGSAAP